MVFKDCAVASKKAIRLIGKGRRTKVEAKPNTVSSIKGHLLLERGPRQPLRENDWKCLSCQQNQSRAIEIRAELDPGVCPLLWHHYNFRHPKGNPIRQENIVSLTQTAGHDFASTIVFSHDLGQSGSSGRENICPWGRDPRYTQLRDANEPFLLQSKQTWKKLIYWGGKIFSSLQATSSLMSFS